MYGRVLHGRELTVVFTEENRKKPTEMRHRERGGGRGGRFRDRRRSPPRYSRSPLLRHARSRSRSRDDYSPPPKRRHYSRSVSPQEKRHNREQPDSHLKRRDTIESGQIHGQGVSVDPLQEAKARALLEAEVGVQEDHQEARALCMMSINIYNA